ncbi:MAG TPA: dihydrodipicolinate reductase C-terminal domain-containing protein [Woeseiaceae bacterium]|nr:dihydrodipicolinate reductase C-terminal domain-containing protein [Woeseiaceae bacterium]
MRAQIRIGLVGNGRMGQAIARALASQEDLELAGMAGREDDLDALAQAADVLIDFSLPEATAGVLASAAMHHKPLVCGVSGLSASHMSAIAKAAERIPVVYDRNMSQGIGVLDEVLRQAAPALGPGYSIRIEETHHKHKKDAPSGTALKLGETLARALAIDPGEIRYHSERRGEVPGEHTVIFSSANEVLTFSHSVSTRDVFALGALRAARWAAQRAPGQYSMHDVLFNP